MMPIFVLLALAVSSHAADAPTLIVADDALM